MRTLCSLLLALALAGCGHDQSPASTTTPAETSVPAGPTCTEAAANARAQLSAEMGGGTDDERHDRLEAAIRTSCTDDGWPAEAVECVATAPDHEHLHECAHALPAEVYDRLSAQIEEILHVPDDAAD
jgi:hypothetical protein